MDYFGKISARAKPSADGKTYLISLHVEGVEIGRLSDRPKTMKQALAICHALKDGASFMAAYLDKLNS